MEVALRQWRFMYGPESSLQGWTAWKACKDESHYSDILEYIRLGKKYEVRSLCLMSEARLKEENPTFTGHLTQPWQLIETAPKDGTLIDLWIGDSRYADCLWSSRDEIFFNWHDYHGLLQLQEDEVPTHWMPIPAPPIGTEILHVTKPGTNLFDKSGVL